VHYVFAGNEGDDAAFRARADHDRSMQRMEEIYVAFAHGRVPAPHEVKV
jgi:hypothetical protein